MIARNEKRRAARIWRLRRLSATACQHRPATAQQKRGAGAFVATQVNDAIAAPWGFIGVVRG